MPYIERRGLGVSISIILITIAIMTLLLIRSDWEHQYQTMTEFGLDLSSSNNGYIAISVFVVLSWIFVPIWYSIGKYLAPRVGIIIGKFLIAGVGSKPFLDANINLRTIPWQKFLLRFFNLGLALFAIDFFISNNFFYEDSILIDDVNDVIIPTLHGFFLALFIVTILQPMSWILEDIGLRAYNKSENEIKAISNMLDRVVLQVLRTGSLIAAFATITFNSKIIDSIDVFVRIIFVRAFFTAILITFIFTVFFEPIAIRKAWNKKSISMLKSHIRLGK
ncbi:MAG: hypothetical protein ACXAD7_09795 [Candidatus Kariarchaeaceae archaeon]|jgi:hypothetical protein